MLSCPFCGAPETDRFSLEGHRFLVFRCLFSPEVEGGLTDDEIVERLRAFAAQGPSYFRGTCDRLHVYVTRGAGALRRETSAPSTRDPDPTTAA